VGRDGRAYQGYVRAVYALGGDHLWRSTDEGLSWRESPLPPGEVRHISGGYDGAREVLYAQVGGQVFVRPDLGEAWVERDRGLGPGEDQVIAAIPDNPVWAYAAAGYNVWRTDCGGEAWQ
jgi:photosystem II stability/assembly factor-like uncharacterized protein